MKLNTPIIPANIPHKKIIGDPYRPIIGINDDAVAGKGDLTWLGEHASMNYIRNSVYSAVLVSSNFGNVCEFKDKTLIVVDSPIDVFEQLGQSIMPRPAVAPIIGESSFISETAVIEPNVVIGTNCQIGNNVVVTKGTVIENNVTIHDNTVIGAEPFSYMRCVSDGTLRKRLAIGNVHIESDVEIGSFVTIARGLTSTTIIRKGTKTDCHVHIGHDVSVGKNCLLCAYVGIAGYTSIGDNCAFWARSGAVQRIAIADNTTIMATAVVTKNIKEPYLRLVGNPARPGMQHWRNFRKQ